jgi:hypothetical protein
VYLRLGLKEDAKDDTNVDARIVELFRFPVADGMSELIAKRLFVIENVQDLLGNEFDPTFRSLLDLRDDRADVISDILDAALVQRVGELLQACSKVCR